VRARARRASKKKSEGVRRPRMGRNPWNKRYLKERVTRAGPGWENEDKRKGSEGEIGKEGKKKGEV